MCGSRDMECNRQNFFVILDHFCPMDPENQNSGKMNNTPEDIIILQMHTINVIHMMYGSWDMKCKTEFLIILDHLLPFYPLITQKTKILKKWKKTGWRYYHLHMCTTNDNHMMYSSWDIKCDGQKLLSFWTVFCPFTSLTTQNIKILKKFKKCLEILSFYTCIT